MVRKLTENRESYRNTIENKLVLTTECSGLGSINYTENGLEGVKTLIKNLNKKMFGLLYFFLHPSGLIMLSTSIVPLKV